MLEPGFKKPRPSEESLPDLTLGPSSVYLGEGNNMDKKSEGSRNHQIVSEDQYGRTFHSISGYPADQMFLARLLKGILPVCDVVYDLKKKRFFSYKPEGFDGSVLSFPDGETVKKFEVDSLVLKYIFNDDDHHMSASYPHNVLIGSRGGYFFYDFGDANFWGKFLLDNNKAILPKPDTSQRLLLEERLLDIEKSLTGADGLKFIEKITIDIFRVSGKYPEILGIQEGGEVPRAASKFREEILRRVRGVLGALAG